MLITKTQFFDNIQKKSLKLAFIGMSNVGKSFRSNELKTLKKFDLLSIDSEIEKELNFSDIKEMSEWMGYPYEEKYIVRSKKYLKLEEKYSNYEIIINNNFILDTTGSVVYLSNKTKNFLKEKYLLVLFDVTESTIENMKKLFFESPKTLFWGDSFNKLENETNKESLNRCYPNLLSDRISLYRNLADVIIPAEISQYKDLHINRLLEIISFALPNS
jgi:shikimate kinase